MKKITTFLIVLSVAVALSAGGAAETAGPAEMPTEPVREYPIVTEKPVKLTFWTPLNPSVARIITNMKEAPVIQEWMKRTGIEVEFIHPAIGQEQEQFNLMMASGELPDIIAGPDWYKGGIFQGMEDGVYLDLTDYLPIYAPDYWKAVQDDIRFYREVTDDRGRIPIVASYKEAGDPPFFRHVVKKSSLELIGEDVPRTLEDYERVFDKWLEKGITPYMLQKDGLEDQIGACFGVFTSDNPPADLLYNDEGTVRFSPLEPGFRDYLEFLAGWFEKGYISKDFMSVTNQQAKVLFDTGKLGMMKDAVVAAYNRCSRQGTEVVSCPHIRETDDMEIHYERNYASPKLPSNTTFVAISSSCKHPEEALRLLNYGYTEEGIELFNWGIEGLNWEWKDGERKYNDTMLMNDKMDTETASYYYKMHFFPKWNCPDTQVHANLLKSEGALGIRMQWADEQCDTEWLLPNLQFTSDEMNELTRIKTDVETYVKEMILKFITGVESFDNWDRFISTTESLGAGRMIEITQAAFDRYNAK